MHRPLITLTTDFGSRGSYVAAMKGVILGINAAARLVDVTHEIGPQNIREAGLCLATAAPYFPAGTIHVAVVDPGVGSQRRLLCVRMCDQIFLAPDNGILSWAARHAPSIDRVELTASRFWRTPVSPTFHGRDILAPVAGSLSLGIDPTELGQPVHNWVEIPWPSPKLNGGGLQGEVLAIDRFGNLITSIAETELIAADRVVPRVWCGDTEIGVLARTYSDARDGELVALIGSHSLLEIAVRNGSAAVRLGSSVGAPVRVTWSGANP